MLKNRWKVPVSEWEESKQRSQICHGHGVAVLPQSLLLGKENRLLRDDISEEDDTDQGQLEGHRHIVPD